MTDLQWPATTGPEPVGITSFQLVDPRRTEPLAPRPKRGRRIHVYAWYPAAAPAQGSPRPYFTAAEARTLTAGLDPVGEGRQDRFAALMTLRTNSHDAAALARGPDKRPLLVFCHGGASHALQNSLLMEELASWGYVVLSLGHPYESGGVVLEDGEEATLAPDHLSGLANATLASDALRYLLGGPYEALLAAWRAKIRAARGNWLGHTANLWAEDALFVVDALQSGEVPDAAADIAEAVEAGRVGYFGMSYGAAVTARLCQLDDRAVAGVNIDGAMHGWDTVDRPFPTPLLSLHSDPTIQLGALAAQSEITLPANLIALSPETPLHDDLDFEPHRELGLAPDLFRYVLPELSHMAVTDHLLYAPAGGIPIDLPPAARMRGAALLNRLCLDFFDTYMRGANKGFPEALKADFPELVARDLTRLRNEARAREQTR